MTWQQEARSFGKFLLNAGIWIAKSVLKFVDKAIGWHAIFAWLVFTLICGFIFLNSPPFFEFSVMLVWFLGTLGILFFKKIKTDFPKLSFAFERYKNR